MKLQVFEKIYGNIPVRKIKPYRRNMSPLTTEGWIALGFLVCMVVMILFVLGTTLIFNPKVAAIKADQLVMQSEIEQLQHDQAAMLVEIRQTDLVSAATVILTDPPIPAIEWSTYTVTAYCSCFECCGKTDGVTASGKLVRENFTVAADWSVFPNGTVIEIEGVGIRTVEDNGVIGHQIDMYIADHQAALDWGIQYLRVRVVR